MESVEGVFPGYATLKVLGKGTFGVVYLVRVG